jgi:HK97 family phage portal protein
MVENKEFTENEATESVGTEQPIQKNSEVVSEIEIKKESQVSGETEAMSGYMQMYNIYDNLTRPDNTADWINLYSRDPWTYAGCKAIAQTIAGLKMRLKKTTYSKDKKKKSVEYIEQHPILELLDMPNETSTFFDLFEELSVYLDTVGTNYWEIVYNKAGEPYELYNMRPDRVTLNPRKDGRGVKNYTYQVKKYGNKSLLEPKYVIQFKYFSPLNDYYGLGSIQPAVDEIWLDHKMVLWNQHYFENGTIEGILTTDKTLTKNDIHDIKNIWNQGAGNSRTGRRTPVIGKGIKYEHIGAKPTDVDFLSGRKDNRSTILSVLRVPPVKVGLLENAQYDNYKLQEEDFNRNTIVPRCKKITGILNIHLVPKFKDLQSNSNTKYELEFDYGHLILEDEDRKTKRVTEQFQNGLLTLNEARTMMGRASYGESGNVAFINKNFVPIDMLRRILQQDQDKKTTNPNDMKAPGTPEDELNIVDESGVPSKLVGDSEIDMNVVE